MLAKNNKQLRKIKQKNDSKNKRANVQYKYLTNLDNNTYMQSTVFYCEHEYDYGYGYIDDDTFETKKYDRILMKQQRHEYRQRVLKKFKFTFYCLKFKQKFRDWLWIRVRLPKIQSNFT